MFGCSWWRPQVYIFFESEDRIYALNAEAVGNDRETGGIQAIPPILYLVPERASLQVASMFCPSLITCYQKRNALWVILSSLQRFDAAVAHAI